MDLIEGILYMMWRGLAIGIIISAPMGPVGILCVQRTLEKGRRTGFFTGVGAAFSDLFYCLLTGFGLSFIEEFLKANQNVIQIIGSIVLVVFGVYLFKSNPARTLKKPDAARSSHRRDILQGFLFTFSNPLIIFLIIGLFARFNFLLPEISLPHYITGFAFIFIGALVWWWIVSYFVDKVRSHFNLRSMWLINKIIGCVIMVFALVGVITAISGMASADTREPVYLNPSRGFGAFDPSGGRGTPLVITNSTCDTLSRFLPLDRVEEFSFSFRAANLANRLGVGGRHASRSGGPVRVAHPSWGVVVAGNGHLLCFSVVTLDDATDELFPTRVRVSASLDGADIGETILTGGLDLFDGDNSFRLGRHGGEYIFAGGNRSYSPLLSVAAPLLSPDSIGFCVSPGATLSVGSASLSVLADKEVADYVSALCADDTRRSGYFARSSDAMEGEWRIFDRMFDDDQLRTGGDYRLAIVADGSDYRIVYLSGAVKTPGRWKPGMTKGYLRRSGFGDVYDMEWIDPSGSSLPGEIKAQLSAPGMLDVTFVDHASTMRLRKINN